MQLSEQEIVRREKLVKLRALGINPYPADLYPITSNSAEIKQDFSENKPVIIAGRLMSINIQGKASFAQIQDSEGRIQAYFNRDEICRGEDKSKYNTVFKKLLDLGDFIGIEGELFTTQVGEKTVMVKNASKVTAWLSIRISPRSVSATHTGRGRLLDRSVRDMISVVIAIKVCKDLDIVGPFLKALALK